MILLALRGGGAHTCPADHPVCRRPARQGAGEAKPVKMQRPAGRTILTGLAWSAGLVPWSTADGMIRLHPSGQQRVVDSGPAIIPEPERPRQRPHTYDDYRVKVSSYRS